MKFKALAFDLDGTLIDSKIDFIAMRQELGLINDEPVLEVIAEWPAQDRAAALEIIHRHEVLGAKASTLIEGAKEFIDTARARNIPCAIFTRNSRETALWSLDTHGFNVDLVLTRDDAKPKPDPDGLWHIARTFSVAPGDMLFIGDYVYDLQAGQRAGTPTALYLPQAPDFETADAHFIFQDFGALERWFYS